MPVPERPEQARRGLDVTAKYPNHSSDQSLDLGGQLLGAGDVRKNCQAGLGVGVKLSSLTSIPSYRPLT